jgi:intergrase/recombinase
MLRPEPIQYWEVKRSFIKWMKENYSMDYVRTAASYLERYLEEIIKDQIQLFKIISKVKRGKRQLCLGIRALLNFYETFDLMDGLSLAKYRKVVKIPRTTIDEF